MPVEGGFMDSAASLAEQVRARRASLALVREDLADL